MPSSVVGFQLLSREMSMSFKPLLYIFAGYLLSPAGVLASTVSTDLNQASSISALYIEHCAVCHGDNGDGQSRARFGLNPPPRNFTTAQAWGDLTPERMKSSIRFGRSGTAMVAWEKKLTSAEIDGLVEYIRTRFMRASEVSVQDDVKALDQQQSQSGQAPSTLVAHPLAHTQEPPLEGPRLYKKHCAACHGDKGSGAQWTQYSLNPPPRDFTAEISKNELSRERMLASVTHGRPGTAMMSFSKRLSADQIGTVVDFIRRDFMKIDLQQDQLAVLPQADMSLAFPHGLIGDVKMGGEFYTANCFTCHGLEGMGDGPRSRFIKPKPRNFVASESRRIMNRPALFMAISRGKQGTVMPAWSTVLNNQQIADVAEYVFQTFIVDQNDSTVFEAAASGSEKKKVLN